MYVCLFAPGTDQKVAKWSELYLFKGKDTRLAAEPHSSAVGQQVPAIVAVAVPSTSYTAVHTQLIGDAELLKAGVAA